MTSQDSLAEKHLLLKSFSPKLDLRLLSQFRYTQAKARLRRRANKPGSTLPPLRQQSPEVLCSRTPAVRTLSHLFRSAAPSPKANKPYSDLTLEAALKHSLPILLSRGFRSAHNSPTRL